MWAGTAYGLFYFVKDHFQQVATGNVQRIEEAPNGHLLITTTQGFVEWDGSRVISRASGGSSQYWAYGAEDLFHVMPDRSGAMWYCTKKGIFRQSGDSLKRFLPDTTGDKNGALQAYEDAAG